MRLEEYWGVGPKTAALLEEELGVERAVAAIESADIRALADAGVSRGRATRILRRAGGAEGLELLATPDARDVYDDLLDLAAEYALTRHAADRIRVMTPLTSREAAEDRLERVLAARDAWADLAEADRDRVVEAFDAYDEAGGTRRAAVRAALSLREAGLRGGTFAGLDGLDEDALRDAAEALGAVEGAFGPGDAGAADGDAAVARGADEELDRLRAVLAEARSMENAAFDVLEQVRGEGVRSLEDFQSGVVEYVAQQTDLSRGEIQAAAAADAHDAADFVSTTLRTLVDDLESKVAEREEAVAADLEAAIDAAGDDVEAAVEAVDDIALDLSLARFAAAHDLVGPSFVADGLAVRGARNLFISGDVQPITYGVGEHGVTVAATSGGASGSGSPSGSDSRSASGSPRGNGRGSSLDPPTGDRVAVLTGANSGGKTTLLETLSQVVLLSSMGLPVPAEEAEVGRFDTLVFHRRHASFNAGVLESTLRSIVPPLTGEGRTLMLVDEFEAITEPGRAADLLNGLVDLTVDRDALGVYVTHLADELAPLPDAARTDGIFAEGLTEDLQLRVDYQPRFGTVGKSTPEFIVSRLVAHAGGRDERQAYQSLASAIGEEAVQRTLSDAEWTG